MVPTAEIQIGRPGSEAGSAEAELARVRERCKALGIAWHDKAPEGDPQLISLLEPEVAVRVRAVPLKIEKGRLLVAMFNPLDITAADEVATIVKMPVTRAGVEAGAFAELMRKSYGTTAARIAESLAGSTDQSKGDGEANIDAIEAADVHRMAEQPTLINLVNLLILEAIQYRASDIHIEPFESQVKIRRHGLRDQIRATHPSKLPVETRRSTECHLEWPTEHAAQNRFLDGLHRRAHPVKSTVETEPRVEPENSLMFLHYSHDGLSFCDRAGHRFFAPNILTGLRSGDRDQRVPMRRGRDVDNVDVLACDDFMPVLIALGIWPSRFEGLR